MMNYNNIKEPTEEQLQIATVRGDTSIILFYQPDEIWTDITQAIVPEVQPWYLVSTYGRIYSKVSNCILRTGIINSGYERAQLRSINNDKVDCLMHRLVLESFNPVYNMKELQVNHKDTIKTHNWLDNLEWTTNSENMIHAYKNNLYKVGSENNLGGVYSEEQVHKICKGIIDGLSPKQICEDILNTEYNHTSYSSIYLIAKGKNWKHISCRYGICQYYD